MATGTQVPWTNPGGTPCCCLEVCITDRNGVPQLAQNYWQEISETNYALLYAGGNYQISASANVTGSREGFGTETITSVATGSVSSLQTSGCLHFAPKTASINYSGSTPLGSYGGTESNKFSVFFTVRLGTFESKRWINLSTYPNIAFFLSGFRSTVWGLQLQGLIGTSATDYDEVIEREVSGVNYTTSLTVGSTTYNATASSIMGQFSTEAQANSISHNGSVSSSFVFIPFAP